MLGRRNFLRAGVISAASVVLGATKLFAASYQILRSGGAPLAGATLTSSTPVTLDFVGMPQPKNVKWNLRNSSGTIVHQQARDTTAPFDYTIPVQPNGSYTLVAVVRLPDTTVQKVKAVFSFGTTPPPPPPPPPGVDRVVTGDITGITVPEGQRWAFQNCRSTGNVIVLGTFVGRPGDSLQFVNINEANFVGGGMDPVASDVGLWVMGNGVLEINGTPKTAWGRATNSIPAGGRTVTLDRDPVGWRVGDQIRLTASVPPTDGSHFSWSADWCAISGISGRTITFTEVSQNGGALRPHPAVNIDGATFGCEVLNTTRDVNISGQPGKRSHVFIRSTKPQKIKYATLTAMGPQKNGNVVLGRWPIHFHHSGEGSRGSVVEGVVVQESGSHAFVPHEARGIIFDRCIAWDVQTEPFWWDITPDPGSFGVDIQYLDCVAAHVFPEPSGASSSRLSGFNIQSGGGTNPGLVARGCVAAGIGGQTAPGNTQAAGFVWPERDVGHWTFENNVAHNCSTGLLGWQNDFRATRPPIKNFIAWHNRNSGVHWGAYLNHQEFVGNKLYRNGTNTFTSDSQLALAALSLDEDGGALVRQSFIDCLFDSGGAMPYGIRNDELRDGQQVPNLFRDCRFRGNPFADVFFTSPQGAAPSTAHYDFVNCTYAAPREFFIEASAPSTLRVRVQDSRHGSIELTKFQQAGSTFNSTWNAWVKPIPAFA